MLSNRSTVVDNSIFMFWVVKLRYFSLVQLTVGILCIGHHLAVMVVVAVVVGVCWRETERWFVFFIYCILAYIPCDTRVQK
ncbi:hypothetical protein HanIR_Chr03g0102531 [Helianthus annuus]|nr:hypothetical protein HanIR_Chr03g0102531 [Helianthus annuus]